jgi:hypothetical protein
LGHLFVIFFGIQLLQIRAAKEAAGGLVVDHEILRE